MTHRTRNLTRAAAVLALVLSASVAKADPTVLLPDFIVHFTCANRDDAAIESIAEPASTALGFHTRNFRTTSTEFGTHLELDGIDQAGRMLRVAARGFDHPTDARLLALYSAAPTVHDPALEHGLIGLVRDLGCTIDDTVLNDNPADAEPVHQNMLNRARAWFPATP